MRMGENGLGAIEDRQPVGELKISRDVVAAIARVATLETDGVESLAEQGRVRGLLPRMKKAIAVSLTDDFVSIAISVNLKYGAHIPDVCAAIQNTVKDNVQSMTGKAVAKVNILVAGIVFSRGDQDSKDG